MPENGNTANGNGQNGNGERVVIISCDTHIGPRLKEDLRQYCPKEFLDDYDAFVKAWEETSAYRDDAPLGTTGHYDVYQRLADLDQDGTAGEVIFHGSQNAHPIPFIMSDPSAGAATMTRHYEVSYEHAAVGRHMYNQWLADFVSVQPERHVGLAHLPMWDIEDAIKEAQWARDHGLKGINFPAESGEDQFSKSRWTGKYKYHDPAWEPFWAAINDLDMAFCTHGGAGEPDNLPGGYPTWLYEVNELTRRPVHRMLFAGVFDRYPNLRIVVTEQPGQWFKVKMDDLDSLQWMANMPKKPSDYIRDHVFLGASFMSRFEAEDAIENDYWQNVIWGTDYPHIEGVWKYLEDKDAEPHSHMGIRFAYAGLDGEKVKAMLGLNGVRVYGFDGDHLHKVAQTINAPTLDDINHPLEQVPEGAGMWAFRTVGSFA